MKIYFAVFLSLCFVLESPARLLQVLNYDQQNDKATLVVIATPTAVAGTSELAALPNIETVYQDGRKEPVMGKGVETSFNVLTVLKGERSTKTFVLHHFALAGSPASRGPNLVSFAPKDQKRFLMFLQKEADGRYVAVCGQTDPEFSIRELVGSYP
jgi:hypothetical protein